MTSIKYMHHAELMGWRKKLRGELVARRNAVPAEQIHAWRLSIDRHLEYGFPGLARGVVAFCWPIHNPPGASGITASALGYMPGDLNIFVVFTVRFGTAPRPPAARALASVPPRAPPRPRDGVSV